MLHAIFFTTGCARTATAAAMLRPSSDPSSLQRGIHGLSPSQCLRCSLLKLSQLQRVLGRSLPSKTPLTLNPLKVMTLIRSIVITAGSSSGRANPLWVGLLSGNLPRSDLMSL
uniref:Uncharacterized protein n=1 Tax=Arundo donax TaxID=35708 RepID=A0A0A9GKD1_ARUDO